MAEGYIKLYRQLQEHEIWTDEKFTNGQAWVDLILSVNHKEGEWFNGTTHEKIERGAMITSEVKLAKRWKWGRTKTRNFLEMLEKANMISRKTNSKRTYLKISQYGVWQDPETANVHPTNSTRTAHEQHTNTNKNVKNVNNGKNVKKKRIADKNPLPSDVMNDRKDLLDKRKKEFGMTLQAYQQTYGREMLNLFYKYWTEPNKSLSKMRFELERTWDVKRRLETWANNNMKWDKASTPAAAGTKSADEELNDLIKGI